VYERRNKTISCRRVRKKDKQFLKQFDYPEGVRFLPLTRQECVNGLRPCPFVTCRYHLYLDVTEKGSLKLNYPDREPWEISESCALDVADAGDHTLEEVGVLLQLTRERVRQIEAASKEKLEDDPGMLRLREEAA
jgi:hypothetical protein